jgi:predicted dehydrogenase
VSAPSLRVGIVGAGLIGRKRAAALRAQDRLLGVTDLSSVAARSLVDDFGGALCPGFDELLEMGPDVVIVAVSNEALAEHAAAALDAGAHVLVEKPAGLGSADVERLQAIAARTGRRVKVGFNHRFHPGDLARGRRRAFRRAWRVHASARALRTWWASGVRA